MTFDEVLLAPQDPILGLEDAFQADPNPKKINLSVGVYRDASGKTPILRTVKEAEARILSSESTKEYISIQGSQEFARAVEELIFGAGHPVAVDGRTAVVQTPGGTAALRVAADFLKKIAPEANVWLSEPTWPNHPAIFQAAGLGVRTYPYFDPATNGLAFDSMLRVVADIPAGDLLVLHGCCHNPTGIDPTAEQWFTESQFESYRRLGQRVVERIDRLFIGASGAG